MRRSLDLARYHAALAAAGPLRVKGRVIGVAGLSVEVSLPGLKQGELVEIRAPGERPLLAEVVGFRRDSGVVLPLGEPTGLGPGAEVEAAGRRFAVGVGESLLGRVLDGLGHPMDGGPDPAGLVPWPVDRAPPSPFERRRVDRPLPLGVRALDALVTVGEGQRIGLFAGPGVGKSTLLGQIARNADAEVCVVCLVGERGREVGDFLEQALGPEGLRRSVVVAATSDSPALVRLKAAHVATAIAEWFVEARGRRVLFLLDSVTRFARAQREVGLAAGEPPARQGYPPSVFAALPRLLERAGNRRVGGITAVYTVLAAGGDMDDPIADEVRGILDGHVVLDRSLAERGHWPAIDVLRSLSRLMPAVASPDQLRLAARLREVLAVHEAGRDLVALGAYQRGGDPRLDDALDRIERVEELLRQRPDESAGFEDTLARLRQVLA